MGFILSKLASPIQQLLEMACNRGSKEGEQHHEPDPRTHFLQRLALLETAERDDHQAALMLERGEPLPPLTEAQLEMANVSFAELLAKFLVADKAAERPQSEAGPSESNSIPRERGPVRCVESVECVVCRDIFESIVCLNGPCGHFICRQCTIAMAEVANKNEELFPLQCCQKQLPVDTILSFLHGPLLTAFSSKCAEAATPPNFRVYCPNKTCSHFIGRSPASTPSVMLCPECSTEVCSSCKNCPHPGESCDASREVRSLATREGWKTCPRCKMIVERSYGCDYVRCRCQQRFCYRCGRERDQSGCACFSPV